MWRRVLVVWSASRLAVLSLGLLLTTQLGWHRALEPWQTKFFRSITGWDSVYYLKLSHTGYHPGKDVAFFPLYPATIWGTREVARVGDAVAAVAISNLALLVGLLGMYVLARDRLSEDHARRGILYLVLSPYAFALAMAYSEGLFLALAAWLFVLSDRRRDMAAVPLAFAAGLTRVTGLALVAPLALRAWRRRTFGSVALAAAPLVAFAAHAAWLDHAVGDPLAMVHAQRRWGGHPSIPPVSLADQFLDFARTHDVFFLIVGMTVIAYLALLIPILRRDIFAPHAMGGHALRRRDLRDAAALGRPSVVGPLRPGRLPARVRDGRPRPSQRARPPGVSSSTRPRRRSSSSPRLRSATGLPNGRGRWCARSTCPPGGRADRRRGRACR